MAQSSASEKQEALFQKWYSPDGIKFASSAAEQLYKSRVTRIKDAVQMKKLPDRIPVLVLPSFFPAYHAGFTPMEMMYDYNKLAATYKKFLFDFEADASIGADMPGPGKFFEFMDYKLYAWPGHGVAPERSYQMNEGEYMKADEYDALIQDPSRFFANTYFPRVFGALDAFSTLPAFTGIQEMYGVAYNFITFGLPPMQKTLKALMDAGNEALKWVEAIGAWNAETLGLGYPNIVAGYTKAPFDVVGDTLRGTRGIMMDIFRQPDKLLKAMEVMTPLMIKMGVDTARMNGKPFIFIPLHKGDDHFLSPGLFEKFYWPSLRDVILGLVEEGVVPYIAAEGAWNTRLDIIKKDIPKGTTLWMMDIADMAQVKKTLGQVACLMGNVQSSLLKLGTPQDVRAYVKKLIEDCAEGGGYIVSNGAFFDEAKSENVKAMVDAAKEFGVHK
ncbi:MAG: hypothetical protein JW967_03890 [Dehalococcoidales bacterium]|nr:hypothetical protein [Dehalococcoidales bacterium]